MHVGLYEQGMCSCQNDDPICRIQELQPHRKPMNFHSSSSQIFYMMSVVIIDYKKQSCRNKTAYQYLLKSWTDSSRKIAEYVKDLQKVADLNLV